MVLPTADGASPAIAQWIAVKADHPDALIFFRMGDFYELFFSDAEAAAAALNIALTSRGEHQGVPIPMCGVPVHASDAYLSRLIRRGFRVAIAEQMEPARLRTGKAPLRREVVRLVTPGTLTEDALLDSTRSNLLLALVRAGAAIGAAWLDVSTGLFETQELPATDLLSLLGRLDPAEIVAAPELPLGDWGARRGAEADAPPPLAARRRVAEAFGAASLEAFGSFSDAEAMAAALALDYVRAAGAGRTPLLSPPQPVGSAGHLALDAATRASLEITRARDGARDGEGPTLLSSVQHTMTAGGARLLASWLGAPLVDPAAIRARQELWTWLVQHPDRLMGLRATLRGAPDIARALGRLSIGRGTPRDLAGLALGHAVARAIAAAIEDAPPPFAPLGTALTLEPGVAELLARALADPLPARLDDGGVIAPGFDGELDAERRLRDDSRRVIAQLTLDYAQRFGVAALKIRHHAQLGYVIEVPAAAVEQLRSQPGLILRQAMANGARFTTDELSDLDRRIREAAERAAARELLVFAALVQAAVQQAQAWTACADALARLDVAQSCAQLAESGRWCRPLVTEGDAFCIRQGRHPVVEAALARDGASGAFVPNECDLSPAGRVLLLTGPNMAGKSTFLRQNALAVILAQAGLPVPAEAAEIGVVDRLFSRVGAADDLARGRSTFMVEMTETAAILHQAGPRSMVVVDEIGRGTSTLDGLAIAWAVLEALHSQIRCRTIFATHFHELAQLAEQLPRLSPHTMRVKEWRGSVVFLHEVAPGAAGRSWGVHVAKLAGVPDATVRRAGALLAWLEKSGRANPVDLPLFASLPISSSDGANLVPDRLRAALADCDPDTLTPREALEIVYRLKALGAVAQDDPGLTSP